jgi:hypothetical protein
MTEPSVPLGRVLQATVCTVVDSPAKIINHFPIHSHDGGSHGQRGARNNELGSCKTQNETPVGNNLWAGRAELLYTLQVDSDVCTLSRLMRNPVGPYNNRTGNIK